MQGWHYQQAYLCKITSFVVVKCTHKDMTVLVRAYGRKSELIINRLAELTVRSSLSLLSNLLLEFCDFEQGRIIASIICKI
jgi:hypothetical protein